MSFLTVVKMRDDGDYDVFASFNIDTLDESIAMNLERNAKGEIIRHAPM